MEINLCTNCFYGVKGKFDDFDGWIGVLGVEDSGMISSSSEELVATYSSSMKRMSNDLPVVK
ncbi:predicted protein [Sclerotinia sclerotiorum 1980 UF-70]|uniref:Uncharacterized protein n=1 Tax=Sclerotinia sclerotiorum (strain ATCC 18683 / 1980 / Ss-1) TaxID=665079 RepID=A7ENE5_SCLS1|nr:predicted protein [Sclerotinia sclerotiorum 1980 UF-70]EDO04361.1 predicted protein [Sclerotinia sclerotiorum 1980 UF-70]